MPIHFELKPCHYTEEEVDLTDLDSTVVNIMILTSAAPGSKPTDSVWQDSGRSSKVGDFAGYSGFCL